MEIKFKIDLVPIDPNSKIYYVGITLSQLPPNIDVDTLSEKLKEELKMFEGKRITDVSKKMMLAKVKRMLERCFKEVEGEEWKI